MRVLHSSACSHPGRVRRANEDRAVERPEIGLWAVADGAGGLAGGAAASAAVAEALEALPAGLPAATLLAMVRLGLVAVHRALSPPGGPRVGATTVVALLLRNGHFAALWAGDSRAYLLRDGRLRRLTRDHSLVQQLVDFGALGEAEAERHPQSNVITRALGQDGEVELDKVAERALPGDAFLLCSDGVFKEVAEAALAAMLAAGADAAALVGAAVAAGARDNASAVVVRV